MLSVPVTESLLAVMLAVGFLAAAALATVCYRPYGARGDPLDAFLVVAALLLIGSSGGIAVAYLSGRSSTGYGPAFLFCILAALVVAAVFAFRRRAPDKEERGKGGPQ